MKFWLIVYQSHIKWTDLTRANNTLWHGNHPLEWLALVHKDELMSDYRLMWFTEITAEQFQANPKMQWD